MNVGNPVRALAGAALACLVIGPVSAQAIDVGPGVEEFEHYGAATGTTTAPAAAFFPGIDADGFRYVAGIVAGELTATLGLRI